MKSRDHTRTTHPAQRLPGRLRNGQRVVARGATHRRRQYSLRRRTDRGVTRVCHLRNVTGDRSRGAHRLRVAGTGRGRTRALLEAGACIARIIKRMQRTLQIRSILRDRRRNGCP